MWTWLSEFLQIFAGFIPRPLVVRTDQRVIEFVLGKYPRCLKPGWYIEWPFFASYEDVPVKLQIIGKQQRLGPRAYRWKVVYEVFDPMLLVLKTYNFDDTIADFAEIAFGDYHRSNTSSDMMSKEARNAIRRRIKEQLKEYGVEIRNFSVSSWSEADVQLSLWELQKADEQT